MHRGASPAAMQMQRFEGVQTCVTTVTVYWTKITGAQPLNLQVFYILCYICDLHGKPEGLRIICNLRKDSGLTKWHKNLDVREQSKSVTSHD